jgi:lipopolysaccharide heptosyltransferase I
MRLLIVRLSAFGDIVHAWPLVSAIREARPDASIDWLVDARYESVLDLVAGLNERLVVRAPQASASQARTAFTGGTAGWLALVGALRRRRYDVAIDAQGLLKSSVLARASGARRVVGFDRAGLREPHARWFLGEQVATDRRAHIVRKNLALVSALGITPPAAVRMPVAVPSSQVADHVAAESPGGRYVLVNPGGGWPNKRWEPARFGELAARIREQLGLACWVLWGPGEEDLAADVVARARHGAHQTPATTISDVAALAARAALVVSGDTGPLHLAAAVGAPIVGLYGPTWPERNGPWDPDDVVISRAPACGCHHKRQCRRERRCLDDISVDNVFGAVQRRLAKVPAR